MALPECGKWRMNHPGIAKMETPVRTSGRNVKKVSPASAMPTALKYLLILLTLLGPVVPAIAQGVSFQVSSVSSFVQSGDISEPLGLVSLTAATAGTLKTGSTFSIAYGVATLLLPSGNVACSQPSCNAALALASAGNVATVTVKSDVALSVGDLIYVINFLFDARQVMSGTVTATVSAVSSSPAANPIALLGSTQVQVVSIATPTHLAEIAPTSIAFGNIAVGSSSPPRPTFVINASNLTPPSSSLNISSIVASPSVFTQTNDCPSSLPAGQQCTITVTFTPTALATVAAGSVAITDSALGSPQIVTLTGIGVASAVQGGAPPQILSQFAFGGGWYSALYFTNSSGAAVSFPVTFTGDNAIPLAIPSIGSSATVNLAPQGTAIIEAPNVGSLSQGYVTASLPSGVTGYGVFRQSVPGVPDQEAVVPLSSVSSTSTTLIWDDTAYTTAVAIANPSTVPVTVSIMVWNSAGSVIGTSSIGLNAGAKTESTLRSLPGLSAVVGARGSAQFTVAAGSVAVLGLRFNGTAFTSIPTTRQ